MVPTSCCAVKVLPHGYILPTHPLQRKHCFSISSVLYSSQWLSLDYRQPNKNRRKSKHVTQPFGNRGWQFSRRFSKFWLFLFNISCFHLTSAFTFVLTTDAWLWIKAILYSICSGQGGTGTVFFLSLRRFSAVSIISPLRHTCISTTKN